MAATTRPRHCAPPWTRRQGASDPQRRHATRHEAERLPERLPLRAPPLSIMHPFRPDAVRRRPTAGRRPEGVPWQAATSRCSPAGDGPGAGADPNGGTGDKASYKQLSPRGLLAHRRGARRDGLRTARARRAQVTPLDGYKACQLTSTPRAGSPRRKF